jgi:hypothetical protein
LSGSKLGSQALSLVESKVVTEISVKPEAKFYFEALYEGESGAAGIGFATQFVDPNKSNIYGKNTYIFSTYGQFYFNGNTKVYQE